MSSTYPLPAPRSSRRGSPISVPATGSGKNADISRPTIRRTSSESSTWEAGRVATWRPSLSTVIVSQRSKISLSRWET